MGVLNLTPDSFSDGGKFQNPESALRHALQMEEAGADLIDIGAESTKPGAEAVSSNEEIKRLFPIVDLILQKVKVPLSLDTTKAKVADLALGKGVAIINDVSGLGEDPEMASVISRRGAGVILMHRRGTPKTMQTLASYQDLMSEIENELEESIRLAERAGITAEQIAVDPGLGFSKTPEQNFEIVKSLSRLKRFSRPIVVGASRKSFLGKITGKETSEREFATTAVHALLIERGANVLRVHDVSAARDACLVVGAVTI